jgi:hypothetical protein
VYVICTIHSCANKPESEISVSKKVKMCFIWLVLVDYLLIVLSGNQMKCRKNIRIPVVVVTLYKCQIMNCMNLIFLSKPWRLVKLVFAIIVSHN